ncbi:winged helix DNA-binding domain-containing protein [Murinocardiopsis flavida]|uniref:winged helix DNA-binding domain-containing protein n=1 Tax=Murinocardiopsis flavida TaxID=645275 RepID=UPI000D0CAE18|nr:winged helix DNA-binding domain-containing protein [Murinocardiopsis flavida]
MQHVTDAERRSRLAIRHALAPDFRADSPVAATRAVTALHATEPATVYLSCWARVAALTLADVDQAIYQDRVLVKQLAMRRTLFVFPRDLLPTVWPSSAARVARTERARLGKDVVASGLAENGDDWIDQARKEVLAVLADAPEGLSAIDVRRAVPRIAVKVIGQAGEAWSAPRVLTVLGAAGDIVRGVNTGRFPASQPRWTLTGQWLGDVPAPRGVAEGYRDLVRHWLYSFGPGTEDDIVWWLGATKTIVRTALSELDAVAVSLDNGATGWLLPDDTDPVADPGSWVALLPVLDPTVMGWRDRDFYLGPYRDELFESRGNAGTTVWADGRAIGTWVQDDRGAVRVQLLESVPPSTQRALTEEAERLTEWLGGVRIGTGYVSPAMRSATRALG